MGYRKLGFQILQTLQEKHIFDGLTSVMELGSQDIEPDLLEELPEIHTDSGRISAKFLFEMLGLKQYSCIDFDGAHNALPFDLNKDLFTEYAYDTTFDLVTAMGTAEHVFNQASFFNNLHNLCNKDGVMMISVPMQGWSNHGFYNYHPKFFYQMGIRNQYRFFGAWVYDSINEELVELKHLDDTKTIQNCLDKISLSQSEQQGLSLTVVFGKNGNGTFRSPIDGSIEVQEIADDYFIENQHLQVLAFFGYENIGKVAVFGSARAANIAKAFFSSAEIQIVCFVDDYKTGYIENIPIVGWDEFVNSYQSLCSHLVKGPMQGGDIYDRKGLFIPILEISPNWLPLCDMVY